MAMAHQSASPATRRATPAMKGSRFGPIAVGLLLVLGFAVGLAVTRRQFAGDTGASQPVITTATASPAQALPAGDVPGTDLGVLPRYPGAVRVDYRRAIKSGFLVTETAYVVAGDLDEVRYFYRDVFRTGGWTEADVSFSQGRWTFFVIAGQQEAVVTIGTRGALVEIAIELSAPQATPTAGPHGDAQPDAHPRRHRHASDDGDTRADAAAAAHRDPGADHNVGTLATTPTAAHSDSEAATGTTTAGTATAR